MTIHADVEFAVTLSSPTKEQIGAWASAALRLKAPDAEVCIRVIDEGEMSELNEAYRNKNTPTNVLSFPADIHQEVETTLLGDIAICAPIIEREAAEQNKDLLAHWAHMVVHGCLHLTGYDHIEEQDAMVMESKEIGILAALGYSNPYEEASVVNSSQQHIHKNRNKQLGQK